MFSRKGGSQLKGSSLVLNSKKAVNTTPNAKKTQIAPISESNSFDADSNTQPIADFPSPPVQIVSCRHAQAGELIPLPQLQTAPAGEIPQLTFQKIKQCMRICDFSDARSDVTSKETKKSALNELIDVYSNPKLLSRLTRDCHSSLIDMFAANVFRPLPNIPRALLQFDEVTFEDSAWPHLSLIYILFLKFLEANIDARILQFQLTPRFITQLFAVLDFPDERERAQAKAVISAIFNKVPPQRPLLRIITTNLLSGVPEGVSVNATSHLLELFFLFTAGTPPPLSPGLITAFERVILPLHLLSKLQSYHQQLVRCVLLMIRKDARLCPVLLHFLISHWPLTLDQKCELFIDEVAQVLEETLEKDIDSIMQSLLECVSNSAESPSMTLAEKSLKFIQNNRVMNAISHNPEPLMSLIFPTLFRVAKEHWQRNVQLLALQVMNSLMTLSPPTFKKVTADFKTEMMKEMTMKSNKKKLWLEVAKVAMNNDKSIDPDLVNHDMDAYFGVFE